MNTHARIFALSAGLLTLAACTTQEPQAPLVVNLPAVATMPQVNPLDLQGKNLPTYQNPYPVGTYEHFVAKPAYPNTLEYYANDVLLNQVTRANSKLIICIPQQRARLYVHGQVALDWAVSTGTNGHETPTGVFRILEKEPDHKSNRYGKFVNEAGKTMNGNADLAAGLPEGQTFVPAGMPNWNRLTWDGVGIHAGKVIPGQRLSHGCIRTQPEVAKKFFEHSVLHMPVYISRAVEDYHRGGFVKPIDVKYRPKPGNDYTDMVPTVIKTIPADGSAPTPAPTTPAAPQP